MCRRLQHELPARYTKSPAGGGDEANRKCDCLGSQAGSCLYFPRCLPRMDEVSWEESDQRATGKRSGERRRDLDLCGTGGKDRHLRNRYRVDQ